MLNSRERLLDEDLVLRCKGEDSAAFEELVSRWQVRLWKHAVRLTQDEDSAWDVVQESWMAIVKGIPSLEIPAAFPAWAYKIVTRKSADWVRKRQRHRKREERIASEMETVNDNPPGPTKQADLLATALRSLPGDRRAILALHYVDGFSMNEIASILGIPPGTAKSRLFHARGQLKRIMEENKYE